MILTILSQLKNKKKKESLEDNKTKVKNKSNSENNKKQVKKKDKNKKIISNKKKKKSKSYNIFKEFKKNKKVNSYDILKNLLGSPQFLLLCLVFLFMLIRSTAMITSKTIYLEGHFEYISENKSEFIPDCTKLKKNYLLKQKEVGDIIYYNYNEDSNSWEIDNKKGLKLKIIDENDYYLFCEVLNLDNTIIDSETLSLFSIYNMSDVKVPLKHSFGKYEIYFSMNDTVNILRQKYNIYEEEE